MVDESTDIGTFQQYVTFIGYVDSTGKSTLSSWNMRPVGPQGATSHKLAKMFKQLAADYAFSL